MAKTRDFCDVIKAKMAADPALAAAVEEEINKVKNMSESAVQRAGAPGSSPARKAFDALVAAVKDYLVSHGAHQDLTVITTSTIREKDSNIIRIEVAAEGMVRAEEGSSSSPVRSLMIPGASSLSDGELERVAELIRKRNCQAPDRDGLTPDEREEYERFWLWLRGVPTGHTTPD